MAANAISDDSITIHFQQLSLFILYSFIYAKIQAGPLCVC